MNNESLSAWIDDACAQDERGPCLDNLLASEEARAALSRYQLIGAAMRGQNCASAGFAGKVATALQAEPAHVGGSNVISLAARRERSTARTGWMAQPRVGMALAASVAVAAVAMIVGLGSFGGDDAPVLVARDAGPVQQRAAASNAAANNVIPAVAQRSAASNTQRVQWNEVDPATAQQLNGYLLNHNRFRSAPGQGVGGTLGYARVATYESQAADEQAAPEQATATGQ